MGCDLHAVHFVGESPTSNLKNLTLTDIQIDLNGDGRAEYLLIDAKEAATAFLNLSPSSEVSSLLELLLLTHPSPSQTSTTTNGQRISLQPTGTSVCGMRNQSVFAGRQHSGQANISIRLISLG